MFNPPGVGPALPSYFKYQVEPVSDRRPGITKNKNNKELYIQSPHLQKHESLYWKAFKVCAKPNVTVKFMRISFLLPCDGLSFLQLPSSFVLSLKKSHKYSPTACHLKIAKALTKSCPLLSPLSLKILPPSPLYSLCRSARNKMIDLPLEDVQFYVRLLLHQTPVLPLLFLQISFSLFQSLAIILKT